MLVSYFAHEVGDPAVHKRLRMLRLGGRRAVLFGFERTRAAPPMLGTPIFVLGSTEDGRFIQRIWSLLCALPQALWLRSHWERSDVLLARNLEMLALVRAISALTGYKGQIVYECLDIHRLMLGSTRASKMLRAIERRCLKHVSFILTSSPAFMENYFIPTQGYTGAYKIVENKVFESALEHPVQAQQPTHKPRNPAAPWRLAWAGVLRCSKTLETLQALARQSDGRVEVDLWGTPALEQLPNFHDIVSATPHMTYHGAYKREDLDRLYGQAHFVWTGDYYEQGGNSEWLLPNRLYEGLYYGTTPIAVAGTQTAKWLADHDVGVIIDDSIDTALSNFLQGLDADAYRQLESKTAAVNKTALAFSREECLRLLDRP